MSAPTPEQVQALASLLPWPYDDGEYIPHESQTLKDAGHRRRQETARRILASDWLREHDRQVREAALAPVLALADEWDRLESEHGSVLTLSWLGTPAPPRCWGR